MDIAYIQFGQFGGPYQTIMADGLAIDSTCRPNPYAMGYGRKIPSPYRVLFRGRWRRVYVMCYGNSGTEYVLINGQETKVDIHLNDKDSDNV